MMFFSAACMTRILYETGARKCEWLAAASIGGFTWSLGVELDGDSSREEASPSTGRGMSLGSVWRGRAPDEDQLLDVLVAS